MRESTVIHESAEDYLEMMLMLKESKGYIRSIDVAAGLGVTKPSVSYAVRRLREKGLITMAEDNSIEMTEKGLDIAQKMLERHNAITSILMQLGVSEDTACEDACRIEHDLSDESYEAIIRAMGGYVKPLHTHHSHIFTENE